MVCESCGQREATMHFSQAMGNQRSEAHLCERCARERGLSTGVSADFGSGLGISGFLASLLGGLPSIQVTPAPVTRRCPECGMTFTQFSETGLLGCAQCYQSMQSELQPLIRRIHGTTQHTGKVPKRTGGLLRLQRDLVGMKAEMDAAIAREEFEKAAQIRDRMRALEAKLAGGDGNVVE